MVKIEKIQTRLMSYETRNRFI